MNLSENIPSSFTASKTLVLSAILYSSKLAAGITEVYESHHSAIFDLPNYQPLISLVTENFNVKCIERLYLYLPTMP